MLLAGGEVRSQPSPLRVGGKPPAAVLNIGHRGARAFAPENTLEVVQLAATEVLPQLTLPSGPGPDA